MRNTRNLWKIVSVLVVLLSIPVSVYLVNNATEIFLRARGEPANLVVDVANSFQPEAGVWKNFAQGGEESSGMLESIVGQTRALSPDYIRIDHIYDYYDVVQNTNGQLVYNWNKLDREVSAILASGAKPFLSLSYMPHALSLSGSELDLPRSWGEWQSLVQATVEHYSGRPGRNIEDVYYEVWNEPDLFGNFKTYGPKNYLDLYKNTVDGAVRARDVNNFKIGGPSTTAFYSAWMESLLGFTRQNNIRIDFLSWHKYDRNIDHYTEDIVTLKQIISKYPEYSNLEFIISEMGIDSENAQEYDNKVAAAHSLATIAVLDQNIDKAFSFELKDGPGPQKYWGRWGLLTHQKYGIEKKPRYQAFELVNSMVGRYIPVGGQGTWIKAMARIFSDRVQLMVVNYDDTSRHFETVPIKFENLENGDYVYERRDFLGRNQRTEIEVLNGTFETQELFSPNSAAILELEPVN